MNKIKTISKIVFVAMVFMLTGCSLKDVSQPIVKYDISSDLSVHVNVNSKKILKVSTFKTPANLLSSKIWYQRNSFRTDSYLYSAWSEDFSAMVEQDTANTLFKSGLFKSVFSSYSKVRADLVLEGELINAIQHVSEDKANVVFGVRLYLIDAKTAKLIGSKDFQYREKCKSVDALGAVKAYSSIIKTYNKEVILWLKKLVKED